MRIMLKTDEFITKPYEVEQTMDTLIMRSSDGADEIRVPYSEISSLRISESRRDFSNFELVTGVIFYEGTVDKKQALSNFIGVLKERLPGTISMEYVKP